MTNTAPGILTISLSAMAENYRAFKSMTKANVAGVLKADAYGTGLPQAFKTLRGEGCKNFFVATPDEGLQIRTMDDTANIGVLGGVYPGAEDLYAHNKLTPVLNSLEEIHRWSGTAKKLGERFPSIIHFDTGMNRLGLCEKETQKLLSDLSVLDALDLECIMSHFVSSEEKGNPLNKMQSDRFAKIAAAFPETPKSLSNSSGLFHDKNAHYDMVRPGFALYGGNPTPELTNPVRAVVGLSVRILQIRDVKAGDSAGYNATYTFRNDTSLAVVSMGYADGFLRSGSNTAKLFWNGQPCPIRGRVSMDLIIVDIGHLKNKPAPGDLLEVLGPNQSVDDLAKDLSTNGYEVLTSLGPRYHRVYT